MNLLPVLTTPPAELPLTLAEVKDHCRVDSGDDDVLLTALIHAATNHMDGYSGTLGKALVDQDWRLEFDGWAVFALPVEEVKSIVSITFFDGDGNEQTVDPVAYQITKRASCTVVGCRANETWPVADTSKGPITVTWTAGYGSAADVPQAIKQAMKLLIGHWYEVREAAVVGTTTSEVPMAVAALIAPYRRAIL